MFNHSKHHEVPERTLKGLDQWAKEALPPGSFLTAVLTNDLFAVMERADKENREAIYEIVMYVYNELPSSCWGSLEIMNEWEGMSDEAIEKVTR